MFESLGFLEFAVDLYRMKISIEQSYLNYEQSIVKFLFFI